MLSTAHTLISLPFAYTMYNPLLIFLAAAVLHLLCDTILHWNFYPEVHKRYFHALAFYDVFLGLGIAWWVTGENFLTLPVLAAIAGGNAPDVVHQLYDLLRHDTKKKLPAWVRRAYDFHHDTQFETYHLLPGLATQVLLIVAALVIIRL